MTKDDIDQMWNQAMNEAVKNGENFTRYRFAVLVAEHEREGRPWVGLEPEEILDLFDRNNVYGSKWIEFARTVEDKLKERNT